MKTLKRLLVFIFFFLFMSTAKANSISSINMDIHVDNNGTAHIKEIWNANLNEGTEGYKPYYNLGNSEIKNFKVSLNGKTFTYMPSWNINASFDNKAYKNGLNISGEKVELCFGISKYGNNSYVMEYDITNFVSVVEDAQIIYWTLIPQQLSSTPDKIYIKIHSDFRYEDNLDVWGYGNYGGEAYVYDGYIEMKSSDNYSNGDYMTVLVKFPTGTFNTTNNIGNNFAYYLDMAKKGSNTYTNQENSENEALVTTIMIIFMVIFGAVAFLIIALVCVSASASKLHFKGGNKVRKDVPYIRDIPFNKDVFKAFWVAKNYDLMKKDTDFFGVMLLKWLKENKISIIKETEKGIFKTKEETSIELKSNVEFDNELEKKLYEMIAQAAVDGILSKNEFKKWANANYSEIFSWFDDVIDAETKKYETLGLITEEKVKKMLIFKPKVKMVSQEVMKDAEELFGLKRFLNDFSRIYEKEPIEVGLWEYYLIFGQLFGIADQVAKDFKDIYPNVITEDVYNDITFVNYFSYHAMMDTVSAKSRAEAYNAGGGGFSSGGGGGGSFGGGGGGGGFR